MKVKITVILLTLFFVGQIYAQEAPKIRFGKVTEERLKMTVYEPDTTAAAVILFDDGQSMLKYDVSKKKDKKGGRKAKEE